MSESSEKVDEQKRATSTLLLSVAFLWLSVGTLLTITKGLPYIDYGINWFWRYLIFAAPAVVLAVMSGYLRIADLRSLVKMIPKVKFESRSTPVEEDKK